MRKVSFLIFASILAFGSVNAQAIADNVTIPVSVTINSILRMNVVSGGNIEFVINTLDQYQQGVFNTDRYTTTFTVAASQDFDVEMWSDTEFIGADDPTNNWMPVDNLGWIIEYDGNDPGAVDSRYYLGGQNPSVATAQKMEVGTPLAIITSLTEGAGDVLQNRFKIRWELGTMRGTMNTLSLMQQNLNADRYTANIQLVLRAQ